MHVAAELVGADAERHLPCTTADECDPRLLPPARAEQMEVGGCALVGDDELVRPRARMPDSGAVGTLERDRRGRGDSPVERPRGGGGRQGQRRCKHEAESERAACHLEDAYVEKPGSDCRGEGLTPLRGKPRT